MEQDLQQPDHAIVVQLDSRDAAVTGECGLRKGCKVAGVDGAGEKLGLRLEVACVCGGQAVLECRQVLQMAGDRDVVCVVQKGLCPEKSVASRTA
jgi:hypothetical protein